LFGSAKFSCGTRWFHEATSKNYSPMGSLTLGGAETKLNDRGERAS
jgi:hypothetical protein